MDIYVGTSGPRLAEVASAIPFVKGIVVDCLWNPDYVKIMADAVRRGAALSGRNPEEIQLIARPFTYVAENQEAAARGVLPHLRNYLPDLAGPSPMLEAAGLTQEDLMHIKKHRDTRIEERLVRFFSAAGSAEEIVEQTEEIIKSGATHICYGHPLGENTEKAIKTIGEEIITNFSKGLI